MTVLADSLSNLIENSGLLAREIDQALNEVVGRHYKGLPPWTTLKSAKIQVVEQATVGAGIAVTFEDAGKQKIMLAEAGEHYKQPGGLAYGALEPLYMIPGGFINLTRTEGSSMVTAADIPEDARVGAAREIEEEFRTVDGAPLFRVDPNRLKLMDTKTLAFPNGDKRVVFGLMLELNEQEKQIALRHVARMAADSGYKAAVIAHSKNKDSKLKLPEIGDVKIFDLDEVVTPKIALIHKDQRSLFKRVAEHFETYARPAFVPSGLREGLGFG